MALTRTDLLFIAIGLAIGVAVAVGSAWQIIPTSGAFPPFVWVLLGLGLVEILMTFILGRAPGTLVALGIRLAALAIGTVAAMLLGPLLGVA